MSDRITDRIIAELEEAEHKAWDALARYKFYMFGYWAAQWVKLNRIGEFKLENPFGDLVKEARKRHCPVSPASTVAAPQQERLI